MKEINEARRILLEFLSFHRYPFQYVYGKSAATPRKEWERDPVAEDTSTADSAGPSCSESEDNSIFVSTTFSRFGIAMAIVVCILLFRATDFLPVIQINY
jgi:hypothetical protein